jgi:hypothetical protein
VGIAIAHVRTLASALAVLTIAAAMPGTVSASSGARATDDLPDVTTKNQTHAIYFVPHDGLDGGLDTNGTIARSLDSIRDWFYRELSMRPRMDRSGGTYDISFARGDKPASDYSSLNDIVWELEDKGFDKENKRYLIYAEIDRGSVCAEGYKPVAPAVDTGRYAAVYLRSHQCNARDFGGGTAATAGRAEALAAHEWLHNEGVVPVIAPHHCALSPHHVCRADMWSPTKELPSDPSTDSLPAISADWSADPEKADVMFPVPTGPLSDKTLDIGKDDYVVDHPLPYRNLRSSDWFDEVSSYTIGVPSYSIGLSSTA